MNLKFKNHAEVKPDQYQTETTDGTSTHNKKKQGQNDDDL